MAQFWAGNLKRRQGDISKDLPRGLRGWEELEAEGVSRGKVVVGIHPGGVQIQSHALNNMAEEWGVEEVIHYTTPRLGGR